jgi:hypothetical protein
MITTNVPQISALKDNVLIMMLSVMITMLVLKTLAIAKLVNVFIKLSTVMTTTSVPLTIVTWEFVSMMKSIAMIMMPVP